MTDNREEILFAADENFWRSWIENNEVLAQLRDSELAKRFLGREAVTLPPPAQIELTLEAFQQWLHAAEKKIVDTVKDCDDQLDQIGKSIAEFKKLFFEVRSEMDLK
jgi:hypothetical protein